MHYQTSFFLRLVNQRRSQGRCVTCGALQPPERRRKWRCKRCTIRYRAKPKKHHEHDGPSKKPSPHAGDVHCLRCNVLFRSEDKRLHRQCPKCHQEVIRLMDGLGCEEAIFIA